MKLVYAPVRTKFATGDIRTLPSRRRPACERRRREGAVRARPLQVLTLSALGGCLTGPSRSLDRLVPKGLLGLPGAGGLFPTSNWIGRSLLGRHYFRLFSVIGDDLVDRRLADPVGLAFLVLAGADLLEDGGHAQPFAMELENGSSSQCARVRDPRPTLACGLSRQAEYNRHVSRITL